jgi:hypothetical protein
MLLVLAAGWWRPGGVGRVCLLILLSMFGHGFPYPGTPWRGNERAEINQGTRIRSERPRPSTCSQSPS